MSRWLAALGLAATLLLAAPADAHKIKLFAVVDGEAIAGSVYFTGNVGARGVPIRVYDPEGRLVAETVSDGEGRFRLSVAGAFDHRLVADAGDGHRAEFVVPQSEVGEPRGSAQGDAVALAGGVAAEGSPTPETRDQAVWQARAELERMIEQALSRQITPLREQLAALEERVLWRDVLGGIGYIVGLCGLAAWLLARHRRLHEKTPPS